MPVEELSGYGRTTRLDESSFPRVCFSGYWRLWLPCARSFFASGIHKFSCPCSFILLCSLFGGLPLLLPFVCKSFIVGLPYTTMWTTLRERLRDLVSILLNEFNKVRPRMANLEWANIDQLCTLEEATHLSQKMREAFEDNGWGKTGAKSSTVDRFGGD